MRNNPLQYFRSKDQLGDLFTKGISKNLFLSFGSKISIKISYAPTSSLRGSVKDYVRA